MKPEEAIEILEEVKELDDTLYAYSAAYMEALEVALSSLKEIQNYRKLGTLEELARAKKYIDLAKKHGTIGEMIDSCAEYEEIGTVEECRKAVERRKPKRAVFDCMIGNWDGRFDCPVCGKVILRDCRDVENTFCERCGQAIRWNENLEGIKDVTSVM